ncbi:helix-turn-helix domain-containing protein [Campylobacter pinnipediorum]|uniref:helix-turn-helix domain-containing protein n=1 Tax=Campylobacter pinnipediorum TaxID=1965231 RepID=UPI000994C0B7|nr:helix-turn-helix transcriptional regulator [Campylobacter pinnipediorum]AQW82587.1 transcriptional regulator, XRE family [Campylobacter pinnipediorum subsp. pinnipediorum]
MTIGEKIKFYRLKQGYSQKKLSELSGMSEPAIRNYEIENCNPFNKQLLKISSALNISIYELKLPDFETYEGTMHALFYLENYCNLEPIINESDNGDKNVVLQFNDHYKIGNDINKFIMKWAKLRDDFYSFDIDEDEYENWKAQFPNKDMDKKTPINIADSKNKIK